LGGCAILFLRLTESNVARFLNRAPTIQRLPASGIAVVGAGVTGLSVALHLAERGAGPVRVYERSGVGAGASGVQPGGVRLQWGTEVNCRMALESLGFYREVHERLEPRVDPGFQACGYLFLAHSRPVLERLAANVALQNRLGVPSRMLEPDTVPELVPGMDAAGLAGAAFCSEDGYFDRPQSVVEAFAEAAVRAGVELEHDEVVSLEQLGTAWRLGLRREGSAAAGHVVVATGVDAPDLLRPLGVELPIEKESRWLFYSEPVRERLLEPLVVSAERRFAAKQLGDGRVLASDLGARGDRRREEAWREHVREVIRELLPILEYVSFRLLVEGIYDVTPDHQAVLGAVPGLDGLWLAAGFSGHGFMMAPAVGRGLAAAIAGEPPDEFLRTLSIERFARGELVPEPAVV
jgi:sarcosine oxidase subunit beta